MWSKVSHTEGTTKIEVVEKKCWENIRTEQRTKNKKTNIIQNNEELVVYQILSEWSTQKDEMGGACSTYGTDQVRKLSWRDHLGNLDIYVRIILNWILEKWGAK
jgi:hypothetical protein